MIKKDKDFLLFTGIVSFIYILPIILADITYVDDFRRMLTGLGWLQDGRLVTHYLYQILSFSRFSLDLYPLPLLIGSICVLFAALFTYKSLFYEISPFWGSFIVFPLIANPFYLENLSFRFDSMSMGLSILLAVLSFYFVSQGGRNNILKGGGVLLICLLTYQPGMILFIGLSFLFFVKNILNKENTKIQLIKLLISALIMLIAYFIYYFLVKSYINQASIKASKELISLDKSGFNYLILNIKKSIDLLKLFIYNRMTILLFVVPYLVTSILIYVVLIKNKMNLKEGYNIISFILCLLSPVILFVIIFFPFLLLKNPVIAARIFIGFSIFLIYSFYGLYLILRRVRIHYIIFFPLLYLLTLSYAYANASKSQIVFENELKNYIIEDLKSLDKVKDVKKMILVGNEPYSPMTDIICKRYPIFKSMIRKNMWDKDNYLPTYFIKQTSMFNFIKEVYGAKYEGNSNEIKNIISNKDNIPIIRYNILYNIRYFCDTVIIEYNNRD